MVYNKVNTLKIIGLFIITLTLLIFTMLFKGGGETNLLKAIIPESIVKQTNLVEIADKTSSVIKIVYESESESELYQLKTNFEDSIDNNYFEKIGYDTDKILSIYTKNPTNFISDTDRKLLKQDDFNTIKNNAINELYNPIGIQIGNFCEDPYFLLTNFLKSTIIQNEVIFHNDKYYLADIINVKSQKGLSPSIINKQIHNLIKKQKQFSSKNNHIYLAGTPIHSYYTSQNSALSINIICILATLLILSLTYFYFRSFKIFIPIVMSIILGFWIGYVVTRILFPTFHITTFLFCTTLIGIGIDYSYHYMFTTNHSANFIKNISISMLTTVIAFALLYLSNIELLKQISIFTTFGLLSIYLFVLCIYSCFPFPQPQKSLTIDLNKKIKIAIIMLIAIMSICGFSKLKFNDSISALYMPNSNLVNAETLYNIASKHNHLNTYIIKVIGDNTEDILEKEEHINESLKKQNIEYVSLAKYMPSNKKQEDNYKLVQKLYNNNLESYHNILTLPQIKELKLRKFVPSDFNEINFKNMFFMDNNTSVIIAYSQTKPSINESYGQIININDECSKYLKTYRKILIKIIPFVYILVFIILGLVYNFKDSIKMILPPLLGSISAVCIVSMFGTAINLFSIIALFLILGFTIDYSIFRVNGDKKSEDAIFISCITTSFSFLALSFTSFKFISSISSILFLGIFISYMLGLFLFKNDTEQIKL